MRHSSILPAVPPNAVAHDDTLVAELEARDVRFVTGSAGVTLPHLTTAELIAGLAQSGNARVRLALIPFFLRHPESAGDAAAVAPTLAGAAAVTLKCYYTAAVLLQAQLAKRLHILLGWQPVLPDWFSVQLGIPQTGDADMRLAQLHHRHRALSGFALNWLGTYRHGAERWLTHCEKEAEWAR